MHLSAERLSDRTWRFAWVRRSRANWGWIDGTDAPAGEDGERYRIEIEPSAGRVRTMELTGTSFDYGPALQAEDGAADAVAVTLRVAQLGARAATLPPAEATWG